MIFYSHCFSLFELSKPYNSVKVATLKHSLIILKFLIWLIAPLEIFIYIYFYNSERVRIFLGASVMLLYVIETQLLFNEMSKGIVESNIDNSEKDVKHILEKRKFRI